MRKCRECKREMLPAINDRTKKKPGSLHHQARGLCTQCYERARSRDRGARRCGPDATEPVGLGEGAWVLDPRRRVLVWHGEKVAKVDLIPSPNFKTCWECGDKIPTNLQLCRPCAERRGRESQQLSDWRRRAS